MPKSFLVILVLITISLTYYYILLSNNAFVKGPSKTEIETVINQAQYFYRQKKLRGEDLSSGPCVSEIIMPNWAVDTVHVPRTPIDDLVENQCSSFREGKVKPFVELDLEGNFVRAY